MFVKDVVVQNQVGLHARPATFFIQKANEFKSSIWIEKEDRRVNAKSLLGILSLGIVGGTSIRIIADGSDEQAAVEGLVELVDSGFSEEAMRKAWKPFYRDESEEDKNHFGLGLYICWLLSRKLGGGITIENNADGGGMVTVEIVSFEG